MNLFLITVLLVFSTVVIAYQVVDVKGATDDSATGSFTIDSTPTVTDVQFVDSVYDLTSTLTPDDSTIFGVNFTVTHNGQMSDLLNVTVWVYDDSVFGSTYQSASPNGLQLIRGKWIESTDTWSLDDGSFTEWTEQSSIDCGSASSATTYDFCFRFDISKSARYDTDWNVSVGVFDDDDDSYLNAETGLVTMAKYFSISFSSATFSWGTVQAITVNNTHGSLSVDVRANANWELEIGGSDFNTTLVDIEGQNIVALDEDGSNDGASQWIRNTKTAVTAPSWDNETPLSDETPVTRNVYIFLSTGSYFDEGSYYEIVVTIWIQAQT